MLDASEVVVLVMVAVLTPIIVTSARAMPQMRNRYVAGAFVAMVVGYVVTIVEGFVLPDLMNVIEHISYAVGGVMGLLALLEFKRSGAGGAR